MYIIFNIDSVTKQSTIVGHVGSNKYRAVAALRKYVELQLPSIPSSTPSSTPSSSPTNVVSSIKDITIDNTALPSLLPIEEEKLAVASYILTSKDGMAIDVYSVKEVETGWIRSIKKKVVTLVLSVRLNLSKQLDILPKPTKDISLHDSFIGELRGVLKSRGANAV